MSDDRSFPMLAFEQGLKEAFQRAGISPKRIFTNVELAEYIIALMREDAGRTAFAEDAVSQNAVIHNANLMRLVTKAAMHPDDKKAMEELAEIYASQDEERQLIDNFDISCWRMPRYMPAHWHSNQYFEIYYCYSGGCPIRFESSSLVLHGGSVLIIAPNIVHATPCYADDAVLSLYHIRSTTFERVFWGQLRTGCLMERFFREALAHKSHAAYLHFETRADAQIEEILSRIEAEYHAPTNYSAQMMNALMSEFFVLLLRRYEGSARLPRTESFYWKHEFSALLTYIESHYHDQTIDDIAQALGYSRRQITRIVARVTGENYASLSLRLRMEKAAELLGRGVDPSSTAAAVGYRNVSSFYRAFSEYHGCTPRQHAERSSAKNL